MKVSQQTIQKWLQEDVPYFDLTTHLLQIGDQTATADFYSRENATLCGSEEVQSICQMENIKVNLFTPSGATITPNQPFFSIEGDFSSLNKITKVAQNIFEYASSISTRTRRLESLAKAANPNVSILTTRKMFPGTKELAIKAVLTGGAYPHRLGLSETILLFKQHLDFIGGFDNLANKVAHIKQKDCEKKIIIEVTNPEDALKISELDIDGIQYDKFPPDQLQKTIQTIKAKNKHLIHLAAGGVNENNISTYAATGINGIVTTSVYFGKPVDIGVKFHSLHTNN